MNYLNYAIRCLKNKGIIHLYLFCEEDKINKQKKKIEVMDLAALGTSPDEVGCDSPKSEVIEFMPTEARKGGQKFEGEPAEITAQVANLLANEANVL